MSKIRTEVNIATFNKSTGYSFKLSKNKILPFDVSKDKKGKNFYISYIQQKDLLTTLFKINPNLMKTLF